MEQFSKIDLGRGFKNNKEFVHHLLVHYSFSRQARKEALKITNENRKCEGNSTLACFRN
jgi:hypothetical protein